MSVAIYMEGGGDSGNTKAALRQGMNAMLNQLKQAAREKAMHWKLVCCGPRQEAFRHFQNAVRNGNDTIVVLLVDAEGPVEQELRGHLLSRDGWDLNFADGDAVHLMVQTMETWIVADPAALVEYYGQGFNVGVLPRRPNLEEVPKADVEGSLNRATDGARKGRYHKIRHASDLLQRIDAEKVKAKCRHCRRLFIEVERMIHAA